MPRGLARGDIALAVRTFVDAFNSGDLEAFAAALSPTVEIQGRRGLVIGRDEAREWARRGPGELRQRLVLDEVRADGHPPVALLRREWCWEGSGDVADDEELAALVVLDENGLIARWQPFDERSSALEAAGIAT